VLAGAWVSSAKYSALRRREEVDECLRVLAPRQPCRGSRPVVRIIEPGSSPGMKWFSVVVLGSSAFACSKE
jgi:hypothetical protein